MIEIECPSGLRGIIRGFKVKDEALYLDQNLVRQGRYIGSLVASCWEQTLDPGPYENLLGVSGKLDWDGVLQGDRYFAFLKARVATRGPEYEFEIQQCGNGACRRRYDWACNLDELPVRKLDPAVKAAFMAGESSALEIEGLPAILCRPLIGRDEQWMARVAEKEPTKLLLWATVRRIVKIEGVGNDARKIKDFVENLDGAVADALRDGLEELDCGPENVFEVQCPQCGYYQQVTLPFEPTFFSGRKRLQRKADAVGFA